MNKVLFIVEGLNDEIKYIKRLFHVCSNFQKYEIVPYKTNLHNLANDIMFNGEIDKTLDIKNVLISKEKDPLIKSILNQNFSDIVMVFDFEPQQDVPRFELIRKMLLHFNNSTENGKLYINYPMMQSYRHFENLPDMQFFKLKTKKEECYHYKEIVNNVSRRYQNTSHHNYALFVSLSYHHLIKLNYILNGKNELPDINFIRNWNQVDLFDIQYEMLKTKNEIYVINTFSLYLIEFNPSEYYNQITRHSAKYTI